MPECRGLYLLKLVPRIQFITKGYDSGKSQMGGMHRARYWEKTQNFHALSGCTHISTCSPGRNLGLPHSSEVLWRLHYIGVMGHDSFLNSNSSDFPA